MDLVVRLLGESASYTATMSRAMIETNKFDRRLENLTTTMQRQAVASQLSSREQQVLAIADQGATSAAAEYALAVARELDSLDALAAAERRATAEKQAAAAIAKAEADRRNATAMQIVASLQQEKLSITEGATAARLYAIEQTNLTRAQKDAVISLTQRNAALAKAAADERKAAQTTAENQAAVQRMIQASHQEARAYQEVAIVARLKEAALKGATQAELDEIATAYQVAQRNEQVAAAYKSRTEASRQATTATTAHGGASRNTTMAVQALAFGLQDAAQVYGTTGLAGAISASANNLIFFTSLVSPQLAIFTSLTVAVGQFAAVLGPSILGIQNKADRIKELIEQQRAWLDIQTKLNDQIRQGNRAMESAKDAGSAKNLREQRESSLRDNREEQRQIQEQVAKQRELREALRQRVRDTQDNQNGWGIIGNALGMTQQAEYLKQIEETNKAILEQETRRAELLQREALLQKQIEEAKANETQRDREKRQEDSNKFNREQRLKYSQDQAKAAKERAEQAKKDHAQRVADRKSALKQIQTFRPKVRRDQMSRDNSKRQKIADEYAERMRLIEEWRKKNILTANEIGEAQHQARMAAQAKRLRLDSDITAAKRKKMAAANKKAMAAARRGRRSTGQNTAVNANSADAFKMIWDATNGGQGVQQAILKELQANGKATYRLINLYEDSINAIKQVGVVRGKK